MAAGDIIVYISLIVSLIVLFFIIWDHLKDDRILTMRVQEFYEDIEMLIFTMLQVKYYEALQETESDMDEKQLSMLKKNKNRDVIQNAYLMKKIYQNFNLFSNYLGLTHDKDNKSYITGTIYLLNEDGAILKRNIELNTINPLITSYREISRNQISEILIFLNSMRFYWNKKYKKSIFRPALIQKIDFNALLGYINPLKISPKKKWSIRKHA
jgi:hypothetical protein